MRLRMNRLAMIVFAGINLARCSSGSTGLPSRLWTARLTGRAVNSAGANVSGASVVVTPVFLDGSSRARVGRCTGGGGAELTGLSDGNGRFEFTWNGAVIPAFVCLVFSGTAGAGSTALSGLVELDSITLGPGGLDSVEVRLVLK